MTFIQLALFRFIPFYHLDLLFFNFSYILTLLLADGIKSYFQLVYLLDISCEHFLEAVLAVQNRLEKLVLALLLLVSFEGSFDFADNSLALFQVPILVK